MQNVETLSLSGQKNGMRHHSSDIDPDDRTMRNQPRQIQRNRSRTAFEVQNAEVWSAVRRLKTVVFNVL